MKPALLEEYPVHQGRAARFLRTRRAALPTDARSRRVPFERAGRAYRANPPRRWAREERAFVEHAAAVQDRVRPGSFFVLGDSYIRQARHPWRRRTGATYGQNTYYGQKLFFRAPSGEMYVATIPGLTYTPEPKPTDIPHLHEILSLSESCGAACTQRPDPRRTRK